MLIVKRHDDKDSDRLKVKGWKQALYQQNTNQRKAGTAVLLTHKIRL